jgi:hypothetical protein
MVTRGMYRHWKGHAYMVYGVACLKHENERRIVIYTSAKTEEEKRFDFLARDEKEFEEFVDDRTGKKVSLTVAESNALTEAELKHLVRRFARITDPELSIVPASL